MSSYCVALIVNPQKEFLAIQLPGNDYWQLPAYKDTVIGQPYEIEELDKMLEELLGKGVKKLDRKSPQNIERNGESQPATTLFPYYLSQSEVERISQVLAERKKKRTLLEFMFLNSKTARQKFWWDKQAFLWNEKKSSSLSPLNVKKKYEANYNKQTNTTREALSILDLQKLLAKGDIWKFAESIRLWSEQNPPFFIDKSISIIALMIQHRTIFLDDQKMEGVLDYHTFTEGKNKILKDAHSLLNRIKETGVEICVFTRACYKRETQNLINPHYLKYLISHNDIELAIKGYKKLTNNENSPSFFLIVQNISSSLNEIRYKSISREISIPNYNNYISQFIRLINDCLGDENDLRPNI